MGHHRGETSRDLVLLRIEQGDTCQLQGPGGATVGGVRGVGGDHEPLDVRKPLRTEVPELVRVFFHPRFPRCEVLADDYPQVKLARLDRRLVALVQQHEPRRRVRGETFRRLVVDQLLDAI